MNSDKHQARLARIPAIIYPEELPIAAKREEIARAIAAHQVVVIAGETGSGKTTGIQSSNRGQTTNKEFTPPA